MVCSRVCFKVVLVLASVVIEFTRCTTSCKKGEYEIRKGNGIITCLLCDTCVHGSGLSPPCGSTLDPPPNIMCKACIAGKSYSDEYDSSSCKPCHICTTPMKNNCTAQSNTICFNKCQNGFYYENATHDCQPCSYCCGDIKDVHIPECETQGIPRQQQCSIHRAQECTPSSTTPASTAILSHSTGTRESIPGGSSENSAKNIIGAVVSGVGGIVLVIALICLTKKLKKRNRQHDAQYNREAGVQLDYDTADCLQDIEIVQHPEQNICDGGSVVFKCVAKVTCSNRRHCYVKYRWKKDDTVITFMSATKEEYALPHVQMSHFGFYSCDVHCTKCQKHLHSCKAELTVLPAQGKRYKLLNEINLQKQSEVENCLSINKATGVGNWKNVGETYGMEQHKLNAMEDYKCPAIEVMTFIFARHPELTVYEFCKEMKDSSIKQLQIVKVLENDLTVALEETKRDNGNAVSRDECGQNNIRFNVSDQPNRVALLSNPPGTSNKTTVSGNGLINRSPLPLIQSVDETERRDHPSELIDANERKRRPSILRQKCNDSDKIDGECNLIKFTLQ